ncbi:oxygenase MpaB family protein [Streptomyces sp. TP-A0874]|uniref:oxygenase MpaB family protein n=1 Tax=Streptomyces sp. TP-A0874 TaxID=549819 RepID=UPI00099FB025
MTRENDIGTSGGTGEAERSTPAPPPVGGVLWSIAGDLRAVMSLPAALVMQVAHPAVSAGVDDYSVFRTDPWGRAERSLRSLQLWVYGGERAAEEGRRLRRLHASIQGTDAHGRPYRALTPDVYAWVHATGFPVYQHAQRYLGRPFSPAQERQLYAEWLRVGRILGLRDQDMPRSPEEFWPYYRAMLRDVIEPTRISQELTSLDLSVPPPDRGPAVLRKLARAAWPVLLPPLTRARRFLTVGLMPPEAREAIGLEWTERQERALRRLGKAVRAVVPVLPERLRYLPIAREARREARRTGLGPARAAGRRKWPALRVTGRPPSPGDGLFGTGAEPEPDG